MVAVVVMAVVVVVVWLGEEGEKRGEEKAVEEGYIASRVQWHR